MRRELPVAVVIPAHNRAGTIERCLRSVLDQEMSPAEVVVVDDASTDGTAEIAAALGDSRLRILRQETCGGAQLARNRGIEASQAPWIAFQDSDDEWEPQRLAMQAHALDARNWDPGLTLHSDCWRQEEGGAGRTLWTLPSTEGENARMALLARPAPMFQGMLASRRSLDAVGLLDPQVPAYQEWETSIRLAEASRFLHLRTPLFTYHFHSGPTISRQARRGLDGYQYVIDKHREAIVATFGTVGWERHIRLQIRRALEEGMGDCLPGLLERLPVVSTSLRRALFLARLGFRAGGGRVARRFVRIPPLPFAEG